MNKEKQELDTSENNADQEKRRRLLKGIVASTPVILSVTSRPVLAGANCTESGQLSGNASDPELVCEGEGCRARFWDIHTDLWHSDYPPRRTFKDVFDVNDFGNARLVRVLRGMRPPNTNCSTGSGSNVVSLGKQAVAALQNAATEVAYPMSVSEVIATVQIALFDSGSGVDCRSVRETKNSLKALNNNFPCPL